MAVNRVLAKAIQRVMETPRPTQVAISMKVISPSLPDFLYKPMFMESYSIIQDFGKNYSDDITVDVKISPRDYLSMHENMDDLLASVTFTYLGNNTNQKIMDPRPITRRYRVMIINPKDIRRFVQGAKHRVEAELDVTLRLIDPVLYAARQRQFHGTFKNTTIDGILRYAAKSFGIKKLYIAPPDNVHVYDHIIIPPAKGFDELFTYLQDVYGVYFKGIHAYFTDGVLYIYPPYEHVPVFPETAHFYLGELGEHAGSFSYHQEDGDLTEIVLDGHPQIHDLTQMGSENKGTGYMMMRSNQVMDGFMTTDETGSSFSNSGSMSLSSKDAKPLAPGNQNVRYGATTDNAFLLLSDLAQYASEVVVATWPKAVPFLLKPGHKAKYTSDDEGTIKTAPGILDAAGYSYSRIGPIADGDSAYSCSAKVRLRVKPDR